MTSSSNETPSNMFCEITGPKFQKCIDCYNCKAPTRSCSRVHILLFGKPISASCTEALYFKVDICLLYDVSVLSIPFMWDDFISLNPLNYGMMKLLNLNIFMLCLNCVSQEHQIQR